MPLENNSVIYNKFEAKQLTEDPDFFVFEGYAATFDKDLGGDILRKGAFKKSLSKRTPRLLYQHNSTQPIGVIDEVKEDNVGLFVKGRMPKTNTDVQNIASLIKAGAIDSFSIGFITLESEFEGEIRILKEVDLYEVSFVTFPMNPKAMLVDMKAEVTDVEKIETKRELEDLLKNSGAFSNKAATYIASLTSLPGSKDVNEKQVEGEPLPEILDALKNLSELNSGISDYLQSKGK